MLGLDMLSPALKGILMYISYHGLLRTTSDVNYTSLCSIFLADRQSCLIRALCPLSPVICQRQEEPVKRQEAS